MVVMIPTSVEPRRLLSPRVCGHREDLPSHNIAHLDP